MLACAVGLSPRLRGSVGTSPLLSSSARVIPAPAGIGPQFPSPQCAIAGYPRACGDRLAASRSHYLGSGLSPRLRGSVFERKLLNKKQRVIPAPAGIGAPASSASIPGTGYP